MDTAIVQDVSQSADDLPSVVQVPVSSVHYTHDTISHRFRRGSGPRAGELIHTLVRDLHDGHTKVDDIILDVTIHDGLLKSFRNRRLWCLKKYAADISQDILINVRMFHLAPGVHLPDGREIIRKFRRSNTSVDGGIQVEIRTPSVSRSRSTSRGSRARSVSSESRKACGDTGKTRASDSHATHTMMDQCGANSDSDSVSPFPGRGRSLLSFSDRAKLPEGRLLAVVPIGPVDELYGFAIENVSLEDVVVRVFCLEGFRRKKRIEDILRPGERIECDPWVILLLGMDDREQYYSTEFQIEAYPKLAEAWRYRVECPEVWLFDGEEPYSEVLHGAVVAKLGRASSTSKTEPGASHSVGIGQAPGILCRYSNHCKRPDCRYRHPEGRAIDRNTETTVHPGAAVADSKRGTKLPMCRWGEKCRRADCWFQHPPDRVDPAITNSAAPPNDDAKVIFVGRLQRTVTVADLRNHFQQFGQVVSARVKEDLGGVSRGFGFVVFTEESAVRAAVSAKYPAWKVCLKTHMRPSKPTPEARISFGPTSVKTIDA